MRRMLLRAAPALASARELGAHAVRKNVPNVRVESVKTETRLDYA